MTEPAPGSTTPLEDDPVAALAGVVVEHLNDDHADALLLVGRVLGERPGATAVEAVGVDRAGLDLVVHGGDRPGPLRVPFFHTVDDLTGVRVESVALVRAAHERDPDGGEPTGIEEATTDLSTIPTHVTRVVAVTAVGPALRQVTVGGSDLVTFVPKGPDQFVYVLAPPPGCDRLVVGRDFSWEAHPSIPEDVRPVGAYYTVRRWRPEAQAIDLHVVVHSPEASGDGEAWALRARPGDPVALWGPRDAFHPPDGTRSYVLVADESGLPAVAAILGSLPAGTPVVVVAEVADVDAHQELPESADTEVRWLHRDGAPAGTGTGLLDAVAALRWPEGPVYAWGGAESRAISAVRRHVREERGLGSDAVSMVGYWRRAAPAEA